MFLSPCPPESTRILRQPEYKVVQRGMSALFECKVKHDPSLVPNMMWLKDNGDLPDHERYAVKDHRGQLITSLPSITRWRKATSIVNPQV